MRYNKVLEKVWSEYIVDGLCGLCGNKGMVDTTRSATSPRGEPNGIYTECICPNGRCLRKQRLRREKKVQ